MLIHLIAVRLESHRLRSGNVGGQIIDKEGRRWIEPQLFDRHAKNAFMRLAALGGV